MFSIETNSYEELKTYYNKVLNIDKSTYKSSNDETTPIECIEEMIAKIPSELWTREDLKILDPCCGNGNFHLVISNMISSYNRKIILEKILYFNDINKDRLENVKKIFSNNLYNLNISNSNFLNDNNNDNNKYDLIVANPPYAKLMEDGKRTSKNHNLIKDFIDKSLSLLKTNGYLLFITPDNWMSYADRNILIEKLTSLQIIHLDIHNAKKYFKKIGSSFTWYIIQNCPYYKDISISGIWKKEEYLSSVASQKMKFIPLLYNQIVQSILSKTILNTSLKKFDIKTSSFLHKYTKKELINTKETEIFKYKLIHTLKQTVYSSKPHKFQDGYKIFISTTDKYNLIIDNCGMTQSIAFILCDNQEQAQKYLKILYNPLYQFINNICRWGNFNNIRIMQQFPIPDKYEDNKDIYKSFKITDDEIDYIINHL
jgi:methylase of polypeptide subunit release factors